MESASLSFKLVLNHTAFLLIKKPLTFISITAVASLLPFLLGYMQTGLPDFLFVFLQLWLILIAQGSTTYLVYQMCRNESPSLATSLKYGLERIISLMVLALLIIITGVALVLGSVFFIYILPWLGYLIIIPIIVLYCRWFVSVPVCIMENLDPVESLGRSAALTQSNRLPIFGLIAVTFIASLIVEVGVTAAANMVLPQPGVVILVFFVGLIPQTFLQIMVPVTYGALLGTEGDITRSGRRMR